MKIQQEMRKKLNDIEKLLHSYLSTSVEFEISLQLSKRLSMKIRCSDIHIEKTNRHAKNAYYFTLEDNQDCLLSVN